MRNKKAYQYSRQLIKESKETIFLNSSVDVNITREALSAASKVNGIIDHVNSSIFLKILVFIRDEDIWRHP